MSAQPPRCRVAVVTGDTLGAKMAGPAIRAWEMAQALGREHDVVLASAQPVQLTSADVELAHITPDSADAIIAGCDVIVVNGLVMAWFPQIAASDACVVVDIYNPFHVEALVQRRDRPLEERWTDGESDLRVVNDQLERGDFFLCASQRQRLFWLGQLAGLGRINPATYGDDPQLRTLVDVVPFGIPGAAPAPTGHGIKGAVDGIGLDDLVVLWGGGVYNWFDAVTVIRAVAAAAQHEPRLKLYFMGMGHPNPDVPAMAAAYEARAEAAQLGVEGSSVFFNDGWVEYDQRVNVLADADVGVSAHFIHVETDLSFRTRMLDYLWARLPIVCTEGDEFARLVAEHDLGEVVAAEDVDAMAAALLRTVAPGRRDEVARNVAAIAEDLTWERALGPLLDFCRAPRSAPDLVAGVRTVGARTAGDLAHRFATVSREEGIGTAARMATGVVRARLKGPHGRNG